MRFFYLLNLQHVILYVFPTLVFIVLLGLALGRTCFKRPGTRRREEAILYRYPEGITDRDAPFPLVLMLIIAGTAAWAFFYIFLHAIREVPV